MSGHLDVQAIDPGMPASFSSKVLIDLLRTEMKFGGVVVTDALNMEPARRWPPARRRCAPSMRATTCCSCRRTWRGAAGFAGRAGHGSLPRPRLVEAATQVLTLRFRLAGFPRPGLSTVDGPGNRDAARAVARPRSRY